MIYTGGINFHVFTDIQHFGGDDTGRLPVRNVRAPHGRLIGECSTQPFILANEKLPAVRGAALSLSSWAGLIEE